MSGRTAVSRDVAAVRHVADGESRRAEARRVADLIDEHVPQAGEETRRKLWTQLGRTIAGGGWLVGATVTADEARAACLEVLAAEAPRRGRGRPSRGTRVELKLLPEEVDQVEALIGTHGADRSEVLATLVRRAIAATSTTREA